MCNINYHFYNLRKIKICPKKWSQITNKYDCDEYIKYLVGGRHNKNVRKKLIKIYENDIWAIVIYLE